MNKEKKEVLRTIQTKKILALVPAVAVGIAMFAAVAMLASPQQAEASHKIVLKFGGVVGAPGFPIQVGGRVSGDSLSSLTGQSFDIPVRPGARFYCLIPITGSSVSGNVVTLTGNVTKSNFPGANPSDPSPVIGVPVIWTVNVDTGFITFNFDGADSGTGFGKVRIPHQ